MCKELSTGPGTKSPYYTVVINISIMRAGHVIEESWGIF